MSFESFCGVDALLSGNPAFVGWAHGEDDTICGYEKAITRGAQTRNRAQTPVRDKGGLTKHG